jgi:hypothetical protein
MTDLATSILRFYNLLITIGHWPMDSLQLPPHEKPPIDLEAAKHLNYSPSAVEIITALPYPTEKVVWNQEYRILELTRLLDPSHSDDPSLPEHVFSLTAPAADGTTLLFDTQLGAIYVEGWHPEISGRHKTAEYRVARHRNGVAESEDWQHFDPGRESRHVYLTPVPARQWFDEQYKLWYNMRRLPCLDPGYDGNRDFNFDAMERKDWDWDLTQRRQKACVELMENFGWPDEDKWDREGFVTTWKRVREEFRREELDHMHAMNALRGDD